MVTVMAVATLWPPPVVLSMEAMVVTDVQEVTAVETPWLLLLLLSVSVEADSRRPVGEVTDGGDGSAGGDGSGDALAAAVAAVCVGGGRLTAASGRGD